MDRRIFSRLGQKEHGILHTYLRIPSRLDSVVTIQLLDADVNFHITLFQVFYADSSILTVAFDYPQQG